MIVDAWSALWDVIESREGALTASVTLDVFWRLPEEIVAPVLSLFGGMISIQQVTTATTWLLFAVALYSLAHLVYMESGAFPEADTGLRLLFAAASLWFFVIFRWVSGEYLLVTITVVGTLFGGSLVFLYYLRRYRGWRLPAPDGRAAVILARFIPGEHLDDEGRLRRDDRPDDAPLSRVDRLAVGMILLVPCAFGGMLVFFLFYTYPLPDLLFLGWIVATTVSEHGGGERRSDATEVVWFDLEETLFDSLSNSAHGPVGFVMMVFTILGLIVWALWTSLVVTFVPQFAGQAIETGVGLVELVFTTVPQVGVRTVVGWSITRRLAFMTWTLTGVFVLMGLTAIAGIWGWICQLRRLPRYLDSLDSPTADVEPRVARPTGFVLPAMAAFAVLIGFLGWLPVTGSLRNRPFALLWPVMAVAVVWSLRRVRTGPAQSFDHEYGLVVAALSGQVLIYAFLSDMSAVAALLQGRIRTPDSMALNVFMTGVVVVMGALPYLARKEERVGGYWEYGFSALLVGGGVLCLGLFPTVTGELRVLLGVFAVLGIVGGVVVELF